MNGECLPPKGASVDEAQNFLREKGVKFVLAQFVDIHGVPKTKAVPVDHFKSIFKNGVGFAGFGVWGMGLLPHQSDYMAVGDLNTLSIVPWDSDCARVACSGYVDGKPHMHDTRNILLAQTKRLAEKGWTFNAGLEPEFSLCKRNEDGRVVPFDDTDRLKKAAYDYKGLSRCAPILSDIVDALNAVDFDVFQVDHEDANGQFEVNYNYADALSAADQMIFVKMAASSIAHQHGAICSFMPKISSTSSGNGMHIHCSIADENGTNLFHDDSDEQKLGLSELAYHFMGGLLHHAHALCALLAPTVNSYKRLVVGRTVSGATWAPVYVAYGDNNRTSMVRIPYGRLEMRVGDSAMNPYLGLAATIAAGLDGVERKLDPGKAHNVNFYGMSREEINDLGVDALPQSLHEALIALQNDTVLAEALGADFVRDFIELKQDEWVEYHRHVADWEIDRYLEFF